MYILEATICICNFKRYNFEYVYLKLGTFLILKLIFNNN